jgi:hypothetical protein
VVLNKFTKIDEYQMRAQILHMIRSGSPTLEKKLNEYTQNRGSYTGYYELLRCDSLRACEQRISRIDLANCPVEVRTEMRMVLTSPQPCSLFMDRKTQLIDMELQQIIKKASSLVGRTTSRCC